MTSVSSRLHAHRGFTLAELAIVLLIVGLLLAGLLTPLTTQVEIKRISDTQKILEDAKEALLGFAAANGRLPCPASSASNIGLESFCTTATGGCTATTTYQSHGRCSNPFDGLLPAVSLGFGPTDNQGYALDGWAITPSNRLRYAVSNTALDVLSPPSLLTSQNGLKTAGISAVAGKSFLYVCSVTPGAPPASNCVPATATLTSTAPAIVYSVGGNAAQGGISADEKANPNPNGGDVDPVFVSHTRNSVAGSEFDDVVTWLSMNTLISRMVAAGSLP